jgi:YVTN family beta-propeller protein
VGAEPFAVVVDRRASKIYVTFIDDAHLSHNKVLVISGRTNKVVATIPMSIEPVGVAVDRRTRAIYVAGAPGHSSSGLVLVISGRTDHVVATAPGAASRPRSRSISEPGLAMSSTTTTTPWSSDADGG